MVFSVLGCDQKDAKNHSVYNNQAKHTSITIKGVVYSGESVNVIGNKVIVDGKAYAIKSDADINLTFK